MNEAMTTTLTPENTTEMFMNAALVFRNPQSRENGRQRLLEILLNTDPNIRDVLATSVNKDGVIKAFIDACNENDIDLLQAFHDIGMSVNAKDADGRCPLKNACFNGMEESVRWLLDHDANVEIQDSARWTPLITACFNGKLAVVEMLLQKNANPDIQNNYGLTALMFATSCGHKEIVKLLLNFDANIDLRNNEGKTALDMTTDKEIKKLIRNHVTNTGYILK